MTSNLSFNFRYN